MSAFSAVVKLTMAFFSPRRIERVGAELSICPAGAWELVLAFPIVGDVVEEAACEVNVRKVIFVLVSAATPRCIHQ